MLTVQLAGMGLLALLLLPVQTPPGVMLRLLPVQTPGSLLTGQVHLIGVVVVVVVEAGTPGVLTGVGVPSGIPIEALVVLEGTFTPVVMVCVVIVVLGTILPGVPFII